MINGCENLNIELYPYRSGVRARGISFHADVLDSRGQLTGVVKTMVVETLDERELFQENPPPLFDLSNDAAQKLFDQLYDLGYRQTDTGTAGHLKATEKHLEDMRKIAFDQLKQHTPIYMGIDMGSKEE